MAHFSCWKPTKRCAKWSFLVWKHWKNRWIYQEL